MLIDTHSHLNFRQYNDDRDTVVKKTLDNGVWMINVGTNYESSKDVVELAEKYEEGVYAAVGLHPINLKTEGVKPKWEIKSPEDFLEEGFDYGKYRELAGFEKVVAVGEVGLDYWYKPKTKGKLELFRKRQEELLLRQLDLAEEMNLPVIFHCRKVHDDLIAVLRGRKVQGVIHCFTGSWEQAEKYLEMGFCLGFNGIIYKLQLDEVIRKTPLERILIETDCPFLVPPSVGLKRNEPIYVREIADRIAEIRGEKVDEIATENARRLFLNKRRKGI
jgi:TatD DNase family protein